MPKPPDRPTERSVRAAGTRATASHADLTVSYDWEQGLLVCGSTREHKEAIKAVRLGLKKFRYSKSLPDDCAWYLPRSRHRPMAEQALLDVAGQLLSQGVPDVDIRFDHSRPEGGFAAAEEERQVRAAERIERREAQATRASGKAQALFERSRKHTEHIPAGQPVLVGHHSERRHRKALQEAERLGLSGLQAQRQADAAGARARGSRARAAARTDPGVTLRRIDRLETELRKVERGLHGHPGKGTTLRQLPAAGGHRDKLLAMQADLKEQIAYWQGEVQRGQASGERAWSADDFGKGDLVRTRHGWGTIKRVNKKTLTVEMHAPELRPLNPAKVPYDRVQDRQDAPELPATPATANPARTSSKGKATARPAAAKKRGSSKRTAAKAKPAGQGGLALPPLAKLDSYHFGGEAHETASMRHDDNGFTVITGTQSKTLKTQRGAEAWIKKRVRPEDWSRVRIYHTRGRRFGPVRTVAERQAEGDPLQQKVERFVDKLNRAPGLDPYRFTAKKRRKYIAIDRGIPETRSESGVYLVDADGEVHSIKGYGVPGYRLMHIDDALKGRWTHRHGAPMREGKGGAPPKPPAPATPDTPEHPMPAALQIALSLSDPGSDKQLAHVAQLLQWRPRQGRFETRDNGEPR